MPLLPWGEEMKYLLIPITLLLWYLTTYYGVYIALIGMALVFSLSWVWLIMGYIFLIGAVFGLSIGIPSLLRLLILKVYGINWFSCIVHSLAGVFGIAQTGVSELVFPEYVFLCDFEDFQISMA